MVWYSPLALRERARVRETNQDALTPALSQGAREFWRDGLSLSTVIAATPWQA
jgi:hypothetical protein